MYMRKYRRKRELRRMLLLYLCCHGEADNVFCPTIADLGAPTDKIKPRIIALQLPQTPRDKPALTQKNPSRDADSSAPCSDLVTRAGGSSSQVCKKGWISKCTTQPSRPSSPPHLWFLPLLHLRHQSRTCPPPCRVPLALAFYPFGVSLCIVSIMSRSPLPLLSCGCVACRPRLQD
jgi:hypothetical protein